MSSLQESQPLVLSSNVNRVDDDAWIPHYSSAEVEELLANREQQLVTMKWWARVIAWETRLFWMLSWATVTYNLFNYMLIFVTLMFAGHLGDIPLAGASFVCLGLQALTLGVMVGMAAAVQTLCAQAYGAKKYAVMGIVCQRSIILQLGAAVLLTFPYWYCGPLLKFIGNFESDAIAEQGQVFARGLVPQLYAYAVVYPMQSFLVAQNIVNFLAYIAVGVFCLHVLLTWLVVSVLDFGLLGAALTLSLSWWVLTLFTGLYISLSPSCKKTWTGFSLKAFKLKGIWPYFKLSVSSTVMMCLEACYYVIVYLMSEVLPNSTIAVDSLSICINYSDWSSNFVSGLLAAAGVRVGNELGAGNPRVAKFSVVVLNGITILICFVSSVIILIFRVGLIKLYTSDSEVIEIVSGLFPLVAISFLINGNHYVLFGQAIGSGRQTILAWINFVAYYVIGLTIAWVLGFKTSLGVAGLYWGLIIGIVLQTATACIVIFRTNWDAEVDKAATRLKKSADEEILNDLVD